MTHGYCRGGADRFSGGDDCGIGSDARRGEASFREREKLSEIEIGRGEDMLRERENSWKTEMTRREDTIRERQTRIAWLEGQIRRLETPRLPPCTDDLRIRLKDVATRLQGWCPEEKALWMADHIVQEAHKTARELGVCAGRSVFPIALPNRGKPRTRGLRRRRLG